MARRKEYTLADLPEAGTIFAMPLEDGRVGICRVIRKEVKEIPCALVAASDWIGNKPPQLNDPAVRRILVLNHHNWRQQLETLWVSSPPPKEFRLIGKIDVLPKDLKLDCNSYAAWNSLSIQVLAQWRWDNEREAVLAEDEIHKTLESAKRIESVKRRAEYLSTISFLKLLAKDSFPTWKNYPPKAAKEGCQNIIQSFIRALNTAEKPLNRNFVIKELQKCIEELNSFDFQNKNFIETVEREDLSEVLEDILNAAEFPDLIEKVEDWRDW
jgi:hypothetical protein